MAIGAPVQRGANGARGNFFPQFRKEARPATHLKNNILILYKNEFRAKISTARVGLFWESLILCISLKALCTT